MYCPTVRTLTLNPSIDMSAEVDRVVPVAKLRMTNEQFDAGGGGINVARILHRLGTSVEAVYLAGGANGHTLDNMLERMGLPHESVPIAGDSRLSLSVQATGENQEYRFVPRGPKVSDAEIEAALAAATDCASPWFVASGSIPRGVADDIYARIGEQVGAAHYVVDTSGPALAKALAAGDLTLVKASLDEFVDATGKSFVDQGEVASEAKRLVEKGQSAMISVSFGAEGAVLAGPRGAWSVGSAPIRAKSTVGAGDSFLAGLVYALAGDLGEEEALRWGTAAGGATAATSGAGLASGEAIRSLLEKIPAPTALNL